MLILGGGITGLAAGITSGLPIYEATDTPGGICSSYYMRAGDGQRLMSAPQNGEAYRFEIGGGHWIFGGDSLVLRFIRELAPVNAYVRQSSVYLPKHRLLVPYPLQNHLRYLGAEMAAQALSEMVQAAGSPGRMQSMADWLRARFGPTLCELFFDPFHMLYTAGLWKTIAPQDDYKSPVDLSVIIQGAFGKAPAVGYNTTFVYPQAGLDTLAQRMAARCDVRYGKRVVAIHVGDGVVSFADGTETGYDTLLSTLPLNRTLAMASLEAGEEKPDPFTAVIVLNIGARKGPSCPGDHWVYVPHSQAGFHRVGFYSHVDVSFLPASKRRTGEYVSIYVEKAYPGEQEVDKEQLSALGRSIVQELQAWEWIRETEVVDPTLVESAYTWCWPNSHWRREAIRRLEENGIYPVGRYARWVFQGIADSVQQGLMAGSCVRRDQTGSGE
jgi:protoporphyrinogen oxidase